MSKPVALGLLACNPKWPLWSELATKLTATRSVPEALEAYTKCVSQRMQMTAEHGQRVFKDCQQITQKNHQVVDKWTAIWKHVKAINARPLSFDKYLTSKWERVHGTGTR